MDLDALKAQCRVTTFRAGGPGGQHQNVTDSAVRLQHLPSGLVVVGRRFRSQHANLQDALGRLAARLKERAREARRRPRRPTRKPAGVRVREVEEKRRRGELKRRRGEMVRQGEP